MTTDILTSNSAEQVRENLISTAIKFLTNPNVQRCTQESKEKFLRSKGLTDIEIQKAIEKCADMIDVPSMTSELMFFHQSRRSWFRDNVLPIIIYGGFAYGAYWFYKNVLRSLLFVDGPKRKTTAECLEDLRKSMDVLNANVSSLRSELQTQHQTSEVAALRSQLETLKCDIASVKGILLNRNQFPSIPTRAEGTSIPAWQRQAAEATSSGDAENDKPTKPLRARTHRSESAGSNSSEGEHATKNSDSSLEIIT